MVALTSQLSYLLTVRLVNIVVAVESIPSNIPYRPIYVLVAELWHCIIIILKYWKFQKDTTAAKLHFVRWYR